MSSVEKHSSSYSKFIANVYRLVYIPHIYVPFSLFQASCHSASSSSSPSSTSGSYKLPQPRSPGRSLTPTTTLGCRMYSATPRIFTRIIVKIARPNTRYPPFHRPCFLLELPAIKPLLASKNVPPVRLPCVPKGHRFCYLPAISEYSVLNTIVALSVSSPSGIRA